eukprot:bmy_00309T0
MHPDATDSSGAGLTGAPGERRPDSREDAAAPGGPGGGSWRAPVAVSALAAVSALTAVSLCFLGPGCWEAGSAGPGTVLLRLSLYLGCAAAAFLLGTLFSLVCRSPRAPPPDFAAAWRRLAAAARRPPEVSTGLPAAAARTCPRPRPARPLPAPAASSGRAVGRGGPVFSARLGGRPRETGLGVGRPGGETLAYPRPPRGAGSGLRGFAEMHRKKNAYTVKSRQPEKPKLKGKSFAFERLANLELAADGGLRMSARAGETRSRVQCPCLTDPHKYIAKERNTCLFEASDPLGDGVQGNPKPSPVYGNSHESVQSRRVVISHNMDKALKEAGGQLPVEKWSRCLLLSPMFDASLCLFPVVFDYSYRDYILSWYGSLSRDEGQLYHLLSEDFWEVARQLRHRLSHVDVVRVVCNDVVRALLAHFCDLKAANARHEEQPRPFVLHAFLRNSDDEVRFLQTCSRVLVFCLLPSKDVQSLSLRIMLAEILTAKVLKPVVELLSNPDYINQMLLAQLEHREQMNEHHKRAYTYAPSYEEFIKLINSNSDVEFLKQLRLCIYRSVLLTRIDRQNCFLSDFCLKPTLMRLISHIARMELLSSIIVSTLLLFFWYIGAVINSANKRGARNLSVMLMQDVKGQLNRFPPGVAVGDYIVEEQEKRNQAYLRQPTAACQKSLSTCELLRKARVGGQGDGNSYQIVVEIIQATTISSFPQLKRHKEMVIQALMLRNNQGLNLAPTSLQFARCFIYEVEGRVTLWRAEKALRKL